LQNQGKIFRARSGDVSDGSKSDHHPGLKKPGNAMCRISKNRKRKTSIRDKKSSATAIGRSPDVLKNVLRESTGRGEMKEEKQVGEHDPNPREAPKDGAQRGRGRQGDGGGRSSRTSTRKKKGGACPTGQENSGQMKKVLPGKRRNTRYSSSKGTSGP